LKARGSKPHEPKQRNMKKRAKFNEQKMSLNSGVQPRKNPGRKKVETNAEGVVVRNKIRP
jgi:hypothetical protein